MLFCARHSRFQLPTHTHIQGSCCQKIRLFFEFIGLFYQIDRALLIECSSLWSGYRALLIKYRAFFDRIYSSFDSIYGSCDRIQGSFDRM